MITYRIEKFSPQNGEFIVTYAKDGANEISYNLLMPVNADRTGFMTGVDLDAFIMSFAPDYAFISDVNGFDASGIQSLIALPPPPTTQDIINMYDAAIENWLDSTVQQRNYKNVESCISYVGDTNPKYAREAEAVKAWRSAVYTQAEVLIAQYVGGDISAVPPVEQIIQMLPQLNWNDPE